MLFRYSPSPGTPGEGWGEGLPPIATKYSHALPAFAVYLFTQLAGESQIQITAKNAKAAKKRRNLNAEGCAQPFGRRRPAGGPAGSPSKLSRPVLRPIFIARIFGHTHAEARPEVRLFQGIARHRVAGAQEPERSGSLNGGEQATIIEEIVW